jgi:glucan phosphorylase
MKNSGFPDYKIPKHDLGIYYDDGLSITKFEDGWQVKIAM